MKKFIPLTLLILAFACTSENVIHIHLPETYGLQVEDQIQANGNQLGVITDLQLFENGKSILVAAKMNAAIEIPIESKFEVVPIDVLGSKMIDVTYSNKTEFYHSNDTVLGFYIDPVKSLIDSVMSSTLELIQESAIPSDSIDILDYLDSIFNSQSSIVIPTH